ncbi:siroheme synthase CysG [Snodgrassella sp. CFCC 13594]|uniref:siroheme synthase CysG n=1 Tax=Snodgrassella sp. CFCC 13594 TaxID=1775559 RepID=UPI00082E2873|nr:siroheme synthase CysG [Snodgrassella sp. CFCC 13594]
MSHYPLFANLNQRAVLLVGGGHVAERKAEALLKAGAIVYAVSGQWSARFKNWLDEGLIQNAGNTFASHLLDTVFLVVAATDDATLNTEVFQAAEAAGKFCNSVDNPAQCSFIVPAIIDRHPIQVAISSGGAAPVLARLWRQKIETLLPQHIGKTAALAGRFRAVVKQKLHNLTERRRFWERLFASDFDSHVARGDHRAAETVLHQQLQQHQPLKQGEVTLVGAGPGDAGLLTLNALQAMQAADVVLYDALVSAEILELVRRDAEKINVGKRAGAHQTQQEEINRLLVNYARQGKRVVRLKGGDPFVFGRGAEECQELVKAGIPFRIVPGVTAGLGATAYAGIPLTHRDYAQTALFITGHLRLDADDMQWHTLARGHQTLVIYMGTIKAEYISKELIAHGRAANTPVAVVSQGTMANQSVRTGQLSDLPSLAADAPTPALMIIGEVVKLREELSWFQKNNTPAIINTKTAA